MPDPIPSPPHPEAGTGRKHVRTAWLVRRRFVLAGRLGAAAGLATARALVGAMAEGLPDPSRALDRGFALPALLLVVAASEPARVGRALF